MAEENGESSRSKHLVGTETATIDDKGRLLVGKKKRERLGEGFTMCLGANGCIVAFPAEKWEELVDQILSYDAINEGRHNYARFFIGTAEDELSFDGQGRVVVPRKLREAADLEDQVVIIGLGDRMEIWSALEYKIYQRDPDNYNRPRRDSVATAYKQMKGIE